MLTILVILFILMYLVQNISFKKDKSWTTTESSIIEKAGNLQFLNEHIKRIDEGKRGNEYSDSETVSSATKLYRELHIKYENGLITEQEFTNEVSRLLYSIDTKKIKQSA